VNAAPQDTLMGVALASPAAAPQSKWRNHFHPSAPAHAGARENQNTRPR